MQNWLLLAVVALGVGYYIVQTESAKPTSYDRVMARHCDIMARLGREC